MGRCVEREYSMPHFVQVMTEDGHEFVNIGCIKRVVPHEAQPGRTTLVFTDGDSLEIDISASAFIAHVSAP
jgi:hypothetical protein